jgi:Fic family protein
MSERSGVYIQQPAGYKAFIPKPLPPVPSLNIDMEMQTLLSRADRTLARLDGVTTVMPNPDLFIAMYVKKEALLSSQIEGTQASLEGVLEYEANLPTTDDINQVKEVINYIKAMNHGLVRLSSLPLSNRLLKEIHEILLQDVRGSCKSPGEFKKSQNWIGPGGAPLSQAFFVPPPPPETDAAMGELEKYFYADDDAPVLIRIALIHAQFETIHPFIDGNGRIGRLLITFYLLWKGVLQKPLLYLSYYLKKNRAEYYDLLMKVRLDGDWEAWVKFFLKGIAEVSDEATKTAREIIQLKENLIGVLCRKKIASTYAIRLLDNLYQQPLVTTTDVKKSLNVSNMAALQLVRKFEKAGILKEITGKKRYQQFLFADYLGIIAKGTNE